MFEGHLHDMFEEDDFQDWLDRHGMVCGFVSWSELEVLPDGHPFHAESLEAYVEDEELALEISGDGHHLIITYSNMRVVQISEDFPPPAFAELYLLAKEPLVMKS